MDLARARRTEPEPPQIDGAKWIALNRGFTLVDADRFDEVNAFVWSCAGRDGKRAIRCVNGKTQSLHHFILGVPDHVHIDHKNEDSLDNRKDNLRTTDNSLNHANISKTRQPTSSRYKGVNRDRARNKWIAFICVRGKRFNLGRYETEGEAAVAYDAAAMHHFGEFAKTNFPWADVAPQPENRTL